MTEDTSATPLLARRQVDAATLGLACYRKTSRGTKHTFKGPVRTLDEPDVGTSDDPALMPAK